MTTTAATDPLAIGTEIKVTAPGHRTAKAWIVTGHGRTDMGQEGMIFGALPNRQSPGDFRSNERFLGERDELLAQIGR